jgi:hypothetical protein
MEFATGQQPSYNFANCFLGRGKMPAMSPITLNNSVFEGTAIFAFVVRALSTVSSPRFSALPRKFGVEK